MILIIRSLNYNNTQSNKYLLIMNIVQYVHVYKWAVFSRMGQPEEFVYLKETLH